jgi:threonine 3-dehydrogenase
MKSVLITGICGEIGHSLFNYFKKQSTHQIIGIDLQEPSFVTNDVTYKHYKTDITNYSDLEKIFNTYSFDGIFHLAGVLSSGGEKNPFRTHQVNANGSINLLELTQIQCEGQNRNIKFIFPSTIAVYGFSVDENRSDIDERTFLKPITMYGVNKSYVENLGKYYKESYKFLSRTKDSFYVDFRAIRFPGLLSADSVPTGGTSDYASEMIHASAQNKPYNCFVRPDSTLPFMSMPDAVSSIISLFNADAQNLTSTVYNVSSFSVTADEIKNKVLESFPNANINYEIHPKRQQIVDSWPKSTNFDLAKKDFNFVPKFDFDSCFKDYLIPNITKRYSS